MDGLLNYFGINMGEFEIYIHCVIPGNIEDFTPEQCLINCIERTVARGVTWDKNHFKTQWGEGDILRIK